MDIYTSTSHTNRNIYIYIHAPAMLPAASTLGQSSFLTLKGCNKNYILISIAQHKLIKFIMKSFWHLHETGGAYLLDNVDLYIGLYIKQEKEYSATHKSHG
jgi:hypothetical protein